MKIFKLSYWLYGAFMMNIGFCDYVLWKVPNVSFFDPKKYYQGYTFYLPSLFLLQQPFV